jgi:peptidyl-tRNA hydrolase
VDSLIDALGTDRFSRLKVGIGREQGTEARDYVLEPLEGKHRESLREAAAHAGKTLEVWIRQGVQACACQFNGPAGEMKAES